MSNSIGSRVTILGAAMFCFSGALAQQAVIPGASGYGVDTPAGRGGEIIRVTNLRDSGSGSLRECVDYSGPRICVFEVSGIIWLESNLKIRNPNITIAGQTAPAPGITLAGAALAPTASDVLIQHLAIRAGDQAGGPAPEVRDTLKIETPDPIQNVIIDHCSISWSIDENISTYKLWDNVTISNSIISEGLNDSLHPKGPHAYGALIDSRRDTSKISFIGNLFAHNNQRNPMTNAVEFVFVNNVVYNLGSAGVMLFNENGMTTNNSIVGNVFVDGPNTKASPVRLLGPTHGNEVLRGTKLYLQDNVAADATNDPWSIVSNQSTVSKEDLNVSSPPSWPQGLRAISAADGLVLDSVLSNAGSRPGQRDTVDARVIADVVNKTGQLVNCVSDDGSTRCSKNAGGWPNIQENSHQLAIPADPHGDDDGDGYSNVEEWLHALSAQVEGRSDTGREVRPLPPQFSSL